MERSGKYVAYMVAAWISKELSAGDISLLIKSKTWTEANMQREWKNLKNKRSILSRAVYTTSTADVAFNPAATIHPTIITLSGSQSQMLTSTRTVQNKIPFENPVPGSHYWRPAGSGPYRLQTSIYVRAKRSSLV